MQPGARSLLRSNPAANASFQEKLCGEEGILCVTAPIPSDLGHGELQTRCTLHLGG